MNTKITLDEVASLLVAMPLLQKQLFLASYASEITILARGYFADKNFETARQCNESLHRLSGHMGTLLRKPEAAADANFIAMIVQAAKQKGWGEILIRSLQASL
jgi:hypothetical protein